MVSQSNVLEFLGKSPWRLAALVVVVALPGWLRAEPTNVILLIGDGMGFEQVKAAGLYAYGSSGTLSLESLPYWGEVTTRSADSAVTDSAAAATAVATGVKVNNGVISMAYPGDGSELPTLLERAKSRGKSTGLVTTTYVTHATPAAFAAHEPSRGRTAEIAGDYLTQTRPDVLLGGGANGMSAAAAASAGYVVVQSRAELLAIDTEATPPVSGQFGSSHLPYALDGPGDLPRLSEMTAVALKVLDNNPSGLFLLVEGGRIDHACHDNDIARAVEEVVEFDRAVEVAMDWAAGRSDTLVLITADHETGGLSVFAEGGAGAYPTVGWSTGGHTSANVPIYGWGVNADTIGGVLDNTAIFGIVTASAVGPPSGPEPADGATEVGTGSLLSWMPGDGALSHRVHLGLSDPPPFVGETNDPSFAPGPLEAGTAYFWRVDEVGVGETTTGPTWTFTTALAQGPTDVVASDEIPVLASVSNDLAATWTGDGISEEITETLSGGKLANCRSVAEHKWMFEVPPGNVVSFHLRAHHTPNNEGDHFLFAFSADDLIYTPLLEVTQTSSDGGYLTANLPSDLAGTVYLRASDTDASKGHSYLDTLFVDHMFLRSSTVLSPPGMADGANPRPGSSDVPLDALLGWTPGEGAQGHDVFFGPSPGSLTLVAGDHPLNVYDPGPLQPLQVYYWRVDELNLHGSVTGELWSFRTADSTCTPSTVHVESIRLSEKRGTRGRSFGSAAISIADECGGAVPGALVTGRFTGDFAHEAPQSTLTNADGIAEFVTSTELRKPSFSFSVDAVTSDGLTWVE